MSAATTHEGRSASLVEEQSGLTVELPIREGTAGPAVIDVQRLYRETGCFTFDPSYKATASCESALTFIDGEEGILLYRGYPIEEVAAQAEFLEVCHLFLHGELPNAEEKAAFERLITQHTMVHEKLRQFYEGFRRDAHPMAIMCGVVGALSAFYHDSTDIEDPEQRLIAAQLRQRATGVRTPSASTPHQAAG